LKSIIANVLRQIKSKKWLEIAVVCLIGVLVVALLLSSGNRTKDTVATKTFSTDEYVTALENRLSKTLSEIDGAGKVEVMITVSSGMQTIHEVETTTTGSGQNATTIKKPVIVSGKPVVVAEKYPESVGVAIVSQGASQLRIKMQLSLAAATALGIAENKIQIFSAN